MSVFRRALEGRKGKNRREFFCKFSTFFVVTYTRVFFKNNDGNARRTRQRVARARMCACAQCFVALVLKRPFSFFCPGPQLNPIPSSLSLSSLSLSLSNPRLFSLSFLCLSPPQRKVSKSQSPKVPKSPNPKAKSQKPKAKSQKRKPRLCPPQPRKKVVSPNDVMPPPPLLPESLSSSLFS